MPFVWRLPTLFHVAIVSLAISLTLNVFTARRLLRQKADQVRHYSYEDDDYPNRLPLYIPPVALVFEDSEKFGISDLDAWGEWRATDSFPKANGFVRLGPNGRPFGMSMFHQMHCLQMIRGAILAGGADYDHVHTKHCFNLIRQAILCASDTTLDPLDVTLDGKLAGADGLGQTHVCRNWEKVYEFVYENQLSKAWNVSSSSGA